MLEKQQKRHRRHRRIRAKIYGTTGIPRLCVFRSAKHVYAQLIDDEKGNTLIVASDLELKKIKKKPVSVKPASQQGGAPAQKARKVAIAYEVGKLIAGKALKNKIEKVVFDRGGYQYHGRVKAVAEGAREGGLKF